jgi:hypothetical protein
MQQRAPYEPLTQPEWDALVQRYNQLQAAFDTERNTALGTLAASDDWQHVLVSNLNLLDSEAMSAEAFVRTLRAAAGLAEPVLPSFVELCEVSARLYLGPRPDTASGQAAGG